MSIELKKLNRASAEEDLDSSESEVGEDIDGTSILELDSKRVAKPAFSKPKIQNPQRCKHGYCAFNGDVVPAEQKKFMEIQIRQLEEALDSVEHCDGWKLRLQYEKMIEQEKLENLNTLEQLREKNLSLNQRLLV